MNANHFRVQNSKRFERNGRLGRRKRTEYARPLTTATVAPHKVVRSMAKPQIPNKVRDRTIKEAYDLSYLPSAMLLQMVRSQDHMRTNRAAWSTPKVTGR